MQRKKFVKTVAAAGLGMSLAPWITSCGNNKTGKKAISESEKIELPKYWLWLRPSMEKTDDDWRSDFAEIRSLGFEAILPQIYGSNKALFNIDNYETEEPWLERIIPLAHEAGLQVHAWMWTMPCNNPRILEEHPDWYVVNKLGESADTDPAYVDYYKFLCPRKSEVREFVQNRVKALAAIPDLDGIHLDYVRMPDVILAEGLQPKYDIVQDKEYPEYDYCYCDTCRDTYKAKTGVDPITLTDPANDTEWYQFRYDAVVDMVNDYLVPVAKENDKLITAAVFPNWESVRQQWHRFDLDAFLPMLYHGFYNADIDFIRDHTAQALERLNHSKPIYSGLFIPHIKPEEMNQAIEAAYKGGAKGFCLFAHGDLNDEMKKSVKSFILADKS